MFQPPYEQIDPAVPTTIPDAQLHDFKPFLDQVTAALITNAAPDILTAGNQLWWGLATLVVVWKGLQIAYSGTFQGAAVVNTVIGLWIPWIMLQFYNVDIPRVGYSFPGVIIAGAAWVQSYFAENILTSWAAEINKLGETLNASIAAHWQALNLWEVMTGTAHLLITAVLMIGLSMFILVSFVILYAITYAQLLWAQIALGVIVLLGPLFIPWLVFQPMSFLFWGWLRALFTFALYGVIAGAVMRVFMSVALGFLTTFAQSTADLNSLTNLGKWTLAVIPLVVCGIAAALKVGQLASMLVSGGGNVSSGFLGMASSAVTGGGGSAGRVGKLAG